MKRLAKVLSLVLVGTMVFSIPVMAKETGAPVAVYLEPGSNIGQPSKTVAAIEAGELISEYCANAITGIWAMDDVCPIGQGGHVILDGEETNVTFILQKPELGYVYSAKDLAASLGGSLMNAVKIDTHVGFGVANVNFYVPGITGAENIHVYHYDKGSKSWTELNITEKRADHILVDITKMGTFAFIVTP